MLTFDQSSHRYFWNGQPVPGASELVQTIKRPFDAEKWSRHVAKRDGKTQEQVLAEWDKKRDDACDRGHELHAAIEATLCGEIPPCGLPVFTQWLKWWSEAHVNLEPLVTEHRMCCPKLWVAGTMDALFRSRLTGRWHIFDWKQNQQIRTTNKYGDRLLRPFDDLHDCERDVYAVQVSIYRVLAEAEAQEMEDDWLLRAMGGFPGFGDSWLLHLTPTAAVPYRLPDLRERVREWLIGRQRPSEASPPLA